MLAQVVISIRHGSQAMQDSDCLTNDCDIHGPPDAGIKIGFDPSGCGEAKRLNCHCQYVLEGRS